MLRKLRIRKAYQTSFLSSVKTLPKETSFFLLAQVFFLGKKKKCEDKR